MGYKSGYMVKSNTIFHKHVVNISWCAKMQGEQNKFEFLLALTEMQACLIKYTVLYKF